MLAIIGVFQLTSGFENGDAQSGFGEALRRPAAGGAGSDDDDVKNFNARGNIHWQNNSGREDILILAPQNGNILPT